VEEKICDADETAEAQGAKCIASGNARGKQIAKRIERCSIENLAGFTTEGVNVSVPGNVY
jgi:hypothetical protein